MRIIERYTNQENEWKNTYSEPTTAYQFDTNETQLKKPKLENPY